MRKTPNAVNTTRACRQGTSRNTAHHNAIVSQSLLSSAVYSNLRTLKDAGPEMQDHNVYVCHVADSRDEVYSPLGPYNTIQYN